MVKSSPQKHTIKSIAQTNAVGLLLIDVLWKSIMKRKQLGGEQKGYAKNATQDLADTMSQIFVPHVRKK